MSQAGRLNWLATTLDRLNVPFMLTGSLVSSLQGEPRATQGIDLVVDLPSDRIDAVFAAFPPSEFYLDRGAMAEAVRSGGMFNVLDVREGDKFDFWLLTDEPFDRSRFARRRRLDMEGTAIPISTPEDTILMKLKWSRDAGGSERQFRDVKRVFELQRGQLDMSYLEQWVRDLRLTADWARLLTAVSPLD